MIIFNHYMVTFILEIHTTQPIQNESKGKKSTRYKTKKKKKYIYLLEKYITFNHQTDVHTKVSN
jgi:hypothetical protein